MAEKKKYWLHRITGGDYATQLSHPLLFNCNILSTGWTDFSTEKALLKIKKGESGICELIDEVWEKDYRPRNRWCLNRFVNEMHAGDIVVVPTWGEFSVYRILDENIMTIETLPNETHRDWYGRNVIKTNGKLQDADGNIIDLGFFRRVEKVTDKASRQEYADQALFSRMKIMQTNADISDLWRSIEDSITRINEHHPIRIREELIKSTIVATKQTISDYTQHLKFEDLVEKYLWAIGATDVVRPATNESKTEEGDADRVAYFEDIKVAVMVQVKKHDYETNDWAVEQIQRYKKNHENADYMVQMWVVSNAESFTEDAKMKARTYGVRLIDGEEFARMILEVGLKHFE